MSEIKYGLISKVDASVLERTLDLICEESHDEMINICEVGMYAGETGNGLKTYIQWQKYKECFLTGIDNHKDGETLRYIKEYDSFYIGDADEMAYNLQDESQHLIFLDPCHCFAHTVSNFFCYAPKVKRGGYLAFHDTGRHIKPFKDFQHGDKSNPDAYISVRKALFRIGLFDDEMSKRWLGFELILDEVDEADEAGGICVFKKLY